MQAFVAVAEAGSFGGAATRLGVARALVSKRIAALERQLGLRLLNRTTRRVSLTGPGHEFLGRSQRILAEFEEATGALANLHSEPNGRLKVSVGVSFAQRHLAALLPRFMEAQPKLLVELVLNDRFVDPVEEGFDLCLRIGVLGNSPLVARRLATVRRTLCAAPAYLERRGVPSAPKDLERHLGLHYGQGVPGTRWQLQRHDGHTIVEVPAALCANNGDVLLAAAIAGRGIINMPTFIAGDALREGSLVPILPAWRPPPLTLSALWPASRYMPAKVRVFVDFLVAAFVDPPPWDAGLAADGAAASGELGAPKAAPNAMPPR